MMRTELFLITRHTIGNTPLLPGHWRPVLRHGDKPDSPDRIVKMACPICGVEADLTDHEIDADGGVSPSVECPTDCGFHNHVQLDGWGDEAPANTGEGRS